MISERQLFFADEMPFDSWTLCFTAQQANASISMVAKGSAPEASLLYSYDYVNWKQFVPGTTIIQLQDVGTRVWMKAGPNGNTGFASQADSNYWYFSIPNNAKVAASGNIMSLLDGQQQITSLAGRSYCFAHLFDSCYGLTTAPELPAITLATNCYYSMFAHCTSLTTVPELPAMTLATNCYYSMFNGCTSLTSAPELPATTLANGCYQAMFANCTLLTSTPELPATTLASNCYYSMFNKCINLTTAPELPATTLANNCYTYMFNMCSKLSSAPELPATTLKNRCYYCMFTGCTSLTSAPELPAAALANECYTYMFTNCSQLNSLSVNFSTWESKSTTENWLYGVAASGIFACPEELSDVRGADYIPQNWTIVRKANPLTFTAQQANSTVRLDKVGNPDAISLETSIDKVNWTVYTWNENSGDTITLANIGDKVYFRANNDNSTISKTNNDYYKFVAAGQLSASGSIQTLLTKYGLKNDVPQYCYYSMFNDCASITTAPELPATTLAYRCYMYMFKGCTSLTLAPELPATMLDQYCYYGMFDSCYGLTTAPELPATTLAYRCYMYMFQNCIALISAPTISATTLNVECCMYMFQNCSSLRRAPELYALNLNNYSYYSMFQNCSQLSSITIKFSSWNESLSSTTNWLNGVAQSGEFYCTSLLDTSIRDASHIPAGWSVHKTDWQLSFKANEDNSSFLLTSIGTPPQISLQMSYDGYNWQTFDVGTSYSLNNGDIVYLKADTLGNTCFAYDDNNQWYFQMSGSIEADGNIMSLLNGNEPTYVLTQPYTFAWLFFGCEALTKAPNLPATTLANYCYQGMFYNTSISSMPELPATTLAEGCYDSMFGGNRYLVDDVVLPATTLATNSYSEMFAQCSSLTSIEVAFTDWNQSLSTTHLWVDDVNANGIFKCQIELGQDDFILRGESYCPSGWSVQNINTGVCFTALQNDSAVAMTKVGNAPEVSLVYVKDGVENEFIPGTTIVNLNNTGDKVVIKAGESGNSSFGSSSTVYNGFVLSGKVAATGDVMGLLNCKQQLSAISSMYCFQSLFSNCSALTHAPKLPATELCSSCYNNMFENCISLSSAPKLPAIHLVPQCYRQMFKNCISLSAAPYLPAISCNTGPGASYREMFNGCSSLNSISVELTAFTGTTSWLNGVASTGTFYCPKILGTQNTIQRGVTYCPTNWIVVNPFEMLRFTAEEDDATISMSKTGTPLSISLVYVKDGVENEFIPGTTTVTLDHVGDSVIIKAGEDGNSTINNGTASYYSFVITNKVAASGSIMSLLDSTQELNSLSGKDYCFTYLFSNCSGLTHAPEFPATTLSPYCYYFTFGNCTNLTNTPNLPAMVCEPHCYQYMFRSCTSLSSPPALPASSLASNCYQQMFFGCNSLMTPPILSATTLANECYRMMFRSCESLSSAPELPATELCSSCYNYMFTSCINLSTAPYLPATTLINRCYYYMFRGCSKLNSISVNFTEWLPSESTLAWTTGVSANGTFTCPTALSAIMDVNGHHIPAEWTVIRK